MNIFNNVIENWIRLKTNYMIFPNKKLKMNTPI